MTISFDCSRLLVIDDNPAIHEDFRKVFASASGSPEQSDLESAFFGSSSPPGAVATLRFDVEDAFQGEEGVEKLVSAMKRDEPFEVAFVDMRMPPGWDGLETIRRLWNHDPDLQIVICTAFSDYSWEDFFSRLGARDGLLILKKPFDHAEVLQLACALSKKRKMTRLASARMATMEQLVADRTEQLRSAHDESERLLKSISSLLMEVDECGIVRRWNSRAESMFSISVDEAVGQPFNALPIQWSNTDAIDHMLTSIQTEDSLRHEHEFTDEQGVRRTLGFSAYRVLDQGRCTGSLFLAADLTEQRQMQQQLQAAQKLEAVGQLAAGVAHEINTPMQYLGDNIEYLRKSFDTIFSTLEACLKLAESESLPQNDVLTQLTDSIQPRKLKSLMTEIPEALQDSDEGVRNVSRIVRAMKEFSHPGVDEKTSVNLNHAVETTLAVARNEWKYAAEVTTELDDSLPCVTVFAGEVNQVFLNLLVNAAHAIIDRNGEDSGVLGNIRITTSHDDDFVEVRVADSGGGIPEEIQDRVFDSFFTTKEPGRGTGQGLAIAHSVIVQKHGGRIWFESETGVGTTFVIRLPREEPDSQSTEDVAASVSANPSC